MKFIWNNIILGILVNFFVAPIAYLRRNKVKNGSFLWGFLSSENMYGDTDWRPKLKNKFLRAYFWMMRNPRQNWYWKDFVEGEDYYHHGWVRVKNGQNLTSWRTMRCLETGNWHGKLLDFDSPLWGKQNITFKRKDKFNEVQYCYRKSTCIPYRFLWSIIVVKRRSGHESGLMQYNFTFPVYSFKKNVTGWKKWKEKTWNTIEF